MLVWVIFFDLFSYLVFFRLIFTTLTLFETHLNMHPHEWGCCWELPAAKDMPVVEAWAPPVRPGADPMGNICSPSRYLWITDFDRNMLGGKPIHRFSIPQEQFNRSGMDYFGVGTFGPCRGYPDPHSSSFAPHRGIGGPLPTATGPGPGPRPGCPAAPSGGCPSVSVSRWHTCGIASAPLWYQIYVMDSLCIYLFIFLYDQDSSIKISKVDDEPTKYYGYYCMNIF